jgi:lysophospholipase L1-like esterase
VVRLPSVTVVIGAGRGETDLRGHANVVSTAGSLSVGVDPASLPPFYEVAPVAATIPAAAEVLVPAKLPLNPILIRNKYMGFGDSLTIDLPNYTLPLQHRLQDYFGAGHVVDDGEAGTRSHRGRDRMTDSLIYAKPAYTLILYGTNDYYDLSCQSRPPCELIDNLRSMLRDTKGFNSLPVLATLPPVNVGYKNNLAPPERDKWVTDINVHIRDLAREQGAVLVDIEAAFRAHGDIRALIRDHVHPTEAGADLMAQTFFEAITGTGSAAAIRARRGPFGLLFRPPGR